MKRCLTLIMYCLFGLTLSLSLRAMSVGGGAGWDFVFRSPMVDSESFVQELLDRDGRLLRFQERFGGLQENGILDDPIIIVEEEEEEEEFEEELMEDDVAPVYVGAAPGVLYQNSEAVRRFHRMRRDQELRQIAEQEARAMYLRDQMAQRMLDREKQVNKQIEEEKKRKKEAAKKEKLKKRKKSKKDDEEVVQAEYQERERDEAVIKFEEMLNAQRLRLTKGNSRLDEIKSNRQRSQSSNAIMTVTDSRPKPLDEDNPMSNSETLVRDVSSLLEEDEEDVDVKKEEDVQEDEEEEEDITIEEVLQLDTDSVVTNNENPSAPRVAWGWRAIGYGTLWGTGQAGNDEEDEQEEVEIVEVTPLEEALDGIALVEFILRVGTPASMLDSQLGMGIGVQFYQSIRPRVDGFRTVYYMEALVALIEDLYNQVAEILSSNEELYDNAVIGDALNHIQRIIEAMGSQRSISEDGLFHQFPNIPTDPFSRLKALIGALAMKDVYSKSDEVLMAAAQKLVVSQVEAKKEAFESAAKKSTDEDNHNNVIVE